MHENTIISFEQFKNIVKLPGSLLAYNCIKNALLPHFDNNNNFYHNSVNFTYLTRFRDEEVGSIGRKSFYTMLSPNESPVIELFWARKLGYPFPKQAWLIPYKSTDESRLQVLQWKILMNIYPSASTLAKMNIKSSDKCEDCGITETL